MREAPLELHEMAASPSWERRCEAAERLAHYDDAASARSLLALLTDQNDTAPIQAAAEALIRRGDEWGARLLFQAIALGDEDAYDHLLTFIDWADHLGGYAMWGFAKRSADAPDDAERDGAQEFLRHMRAMGAREPADESGPHQ